MGINIGNSEIDEIYIGGTTIDEVYIGSNKVRPSYPNESIVIKMKANSSGVLSIPIGGTNTSGNYSTYNWKVSIDGGTETTYSGTGSNYGLTIATGLTANSEHTVIIKPVSENYQWARAFSFQNVTSLKQLLTEVIYDGSYMGYGVSATDTGHYFRYGQYWGCANLTKAPEEVLPDTVTTIGSQFRYYQYYGCTSLTYSPEEAFSSSVTSISTYFRGSQYQGCTALTEIKGWKDLSVTAQSYYRLSQYASCTSNKTVKVLSNVGTNARSSATLDNYYVTSVSVPSTYLTTFKNTSNNPRSSITDSKFIGY